MKKILLTLTLFAVAFVGFGQTVMVKKVGNSYEITFPTDVPAFLNTNDIASKSGLDKAVADLEQIIENYKETLNWSITQLDNYIKEQIDIINAELETLSKNMPYYRVTVDTSPVVAYSNGAKIDFFTTDAELKVMEGNTLVYWFSTLGALRSYEYLNHNARDENAKVWFQCADIPSKDARDWILFDPKTYNSVYEQARRLSGRPTPEINGIIIQPNIGGKLKGGRDVSSIWNNQNGNLKPVILRFNGTNWEESKYGGVKWRVANFTNSHTQIAE